MAPWARDSENANEVAARLIPRLADRKEKNGETELMESAADDANERD